MYESFYKFKNAPFRLSPDPKFFFGSQGHNRALAYLRYGLQQKEGFIVITGAPGTGKTTLSRALLQEVGREKIIVAELNTTHLDADDVLRMVAASFGLEFENAPKAVLLKRLETHFISRHRAGYHILLIVDESQNLPFESIEELRMLSNFYMGKHALIQIFLLGQEQFRESLYSKKMEQLRQRVVASCHLEPLNQIETRDYILHRLNLVGWNNDPQITDRAFARIYALTKGVPRRINTFCDRLFLFGSLDDLHQLKDSHIKEVAKELMYEVSAKDVKLSDIKVGESDEEKSDSNIETETMDSEHLENFSDDAPEIPLSEMSEPEIEQEKDSEKNKSHEQNPKNDGSVVSSGASERQTLRVVTNNTSVVESFEAMPVSDREVIDNKPDWWKLLALAVDYYQNPESHKGINSTKKALAEGIVDMFEVATGKKIISPHLRTDELLGVSDETIKQACINYIKSVLLTSKANYYRRLGVQQEASLDHIRTHYRYMFRLLQSDKDKEEADEQDKMFIQRINQAFSTLRSDEKRTEYDNFLATIENNKLDKVVDYGELDQPVDLEFEAEIPGSISDDDPYVVPSLKQKNNNVLWVILLLCLSGLGAAYYVYMSNMDEVKEKMSTFISESRPVNSINSIPADEITKSKSSDLDSVASTFVTNSKVVKAEPIVEKIKQELKKQAVIEKQIEKPLEIIKPEIKEKPKAKKVAKVKPEQKKEKIVVIKPKLKAESKPKVVVPKPVLPVVKVKTLDKVKKVIEVPVISDTELSSLMSKFSLSYEDGKINKFMSLFSKNVITNNDENWNNIRIDYGSLFKNTEMRVIEIAKMSWDKSEDTAFGEGDFVVTVLRHKADEIQKFTGRINLEVVKIGGKLKIKGMFHAYGDDDN